MPRPWCPKNCSRMVSLPQCSVTHNEPHLETVPDRDKVPGNSPSFNPPCLPIRPIEEVVYGFTPDAVRLTCRELRQRILTLLYRLSVELSINLGTLARVPTLTYSSTDSRSSRVKILARISSLDFSSWCPSKSHTNSKQIRQYLL